MLLIAIPQVGYKMTAPVTDDVRCLHLSCVFILLLTLAHLDHVSYP